MDSRSTQHLRPKSSAALKVSALGTAAPKAIKHVSSVSTSSGLSKTSTTSIHPLSQTMSSKPSTSLLRKPSASLFRKLNHASLSSSTIPTSANANAASSTLRQTSRQESSTTFSKKPAFRVPSLAQIKAQKPSPKVFKARSQMFAKATATYKSPPPPLSSSQRRESHVTPTPISPPKRTMGAETTTVPETPLMTKRVVSATFSGGPHWPVQRAKTITLKPLLQSIIVQGHAKGSPSTNRVRPTPSVAKSVRTRRVEEEASVEEITTNRTEDEISTPPKRWRSRLESTKEFLPTTLPSPPNTLHHPPPTPNRASIRRRQASIQATPLMPRVKGVIGEEDLLKDIELEFEDSPDGFGNIRGVSRFATQISKAKKGGFSLGIPESSTIRSSAFPNIPISHSNVLSSPSSSSSEGVNSKESRDRNCILETRIDGEQRRNRELEGQSLRSGVELTVLRWTMVRDLAEREVEDLKSFKDLMRGFKELAEYL